MTSPRRKRRSTSVPGNFSTVGFFVNRANNENFRNRSASIGTSLSRRSTSAGGSITIVFAMLLSRFGGVLRLLSQKLLDGLLALKFPFELRIVIRVALHAVGASAACPLLVMTMQTRFQARHQHIAGLVTASCILMALLALQRL